MKISLQQLDGSCLVCNADFNGRHLQYLHTHKQYLRGCTRMQCERVNPPCRCQEMRGNETISSDAVKAPEYLRLSSVHLPRSLNHSLLNTFELLSRYPPSDSCRKPILHAASGLSCVFVFVPGAHWFNQVLLVVWRFCITAPRCSSCVFWYWIPRQEGGRSTYVSHCSTADRSICWEKRREKK